MSECGGWKPVSISPLQPYDPVIIIPTIEELQAMDAKSFNKWRTKAKAKWYYFMRKKWQAVDTDEQEDEIVKIYRDGRWEIFRDDTYPCGFSGKKFWNLDLDWKASWNASKPDWYPAS